MVSVSILQILRRDWRRNIKDCNLIPDSNHLGRMYTVRGRPSADTKQCESCFGVLCSLCSISPSSLRPNLVRLLSQFLSKVVLQSQGHLYHLNSQIHQPIPSSLCVTPPGAFSVSCLPRLLLVFPPTLWPLPSQSHPAACSPHVILWSFPFTISSILMPLPTIYMPTSPKWSSLSSARVLLLECRLLH